MKHGIYINRPDFTKCGYLTADGSTTNVKDFARSFDTLGEATDFIKAQGWKNSASVPARGSTAFTCELFDRKPQGYYESLVKAFGDMSMVPAVRAGRCMTNEDTAIWHRLKYANNDSFVKGYVAQAAHDMDRGREVSK